jgi:hypothetical protein
VFVPGKLFQPSKTKHSSFLALFVNDEGKRVVNTAPGAVFTTLPFLCNLQICQISLCYITLGCKGLSNVKHSSSLVQSVSYEEKKCCEYGPRYIRPTKACLIIKEMLLDCTMEEHALKNVSNCLNTNI